MKKTALKILTAIFFTYAVLVATHLGEFWPFSIYPMFSQAGKPWTRSFVRDVSKESRQITADVQTIDELFGKPFALNSVGVHQNDLSNFMSKNKDWSETKRAAIRNFFTSELNEKSLLIYKVRGEMIDRESKLSYQPFILLTPDTTIVYND